MLADYYSLLDVKPGVTAEDLKRAYRHKAKLYHPDTNNSPDAHIQFIQIKEAFDVLRRAKGLEQYQKYYKSRYYHSRDPYFHSRYQHNYHQHYSTTKDYHKGKTATRSETSKAEHVFIITMHLLFIGAGVLILIFPLLTLLTRGFYPYYPILDSIFAMIISMIVGLIMIYKLSLSFLSYLRKTEHHTCNSHL